MKIGIVGAGAMGAMFAYFFNRANIDTVLFEKDPETIANLKQGLKIIIDDKEQEIFFNVSGDTHILNECYIIFIFIKSYNTGEAIKQIVNEINDKCIITTLQNGLGNKEKIAKYIQEDKIVYGSTSIGAAKLDSKTVRFGGMGNIIIGGKDPGAVKNVKDVLAQAGLDATVAGDPDTVVWKKAIINAGINPLGALLEIPNGRIISNDFTKKIQEQIVREAVTVALSLGLSFGQEEMVQETISVCEKTAKNLCSMLQDVLAKRKTEIDSINGIIIEYAKKNSISVPFNEVIYNLVKAKELYLLSSCVKQ